MKSTLCRINLKQYPAQFTHFCVFDHDLGDCLGNSALALSKDLSSPTLDVILNVTSSVRTHPSAHISSFSLVQPTGSLPG